MRDQPIQRGFNAAEVSDHAEDKVLATGPFGTAQ